MASLWFVAGNNWNPLLWRRQVLYKITNQSPPSTHGSLQQRVADVWPGIYTLLDTECSQIGKRKRNYRGSSVCCRFFFHLSNSRTLCFSSCQTDEIMPVRFDEEFLMWVAAKQPLKDTSFLSNKVLSLCGELPIYWLQPIYPKGCLLFFLAIMYWFIRPKESIKLACFHRAWFIPLELLYILY